MTGIVPARISSAFWMVFVRTVVEIAGVIPFGFLAVREAYPSL
jgi:hypothetical protein